MNKVMFDRGDNCHVLVTLDTDQVVRVWDSRNFTNSLYQFVASNQELRSIDMDHQFGRLLLAAGQTELKIYRLNYSSADLMT